MTPNCTQVENLSLHRQKDLTRREAVERKKHLAECFVCQKAYEELLYTAEVLENLSETVSPPDLIGRIQARIRRERCTTNPTRILTCGAHRLDISFGKEKLWN